MADADRPVAGYGIKRPNGSSPTRPINPLSPPRRAIPTATLAGRRRAAQQAAFAPEQVHYRLPEPKLSFMLKILHS